MNELNKNFLNELRNEHKEFGRLLEDVNGFIQKKDIQGIASHMDLLKNGLLAHLKKEDNRVYTELTNVAKEKKIAMVEITVNTFSTAMKGIATRTLKFFDKYYSKDEVERLLTGFPKDFQVVNEDIRKRINNEESVLYPMYDKYCC